MDAPGLDFETWESNEHKRAATQNKTSTNNSAPVCLIHADAVNNAELFRPLFSGPLLSAAAYTPDGAALAIEQKHTDAIAFGRLFIANPDLVERIRGDFHLNAFERSTFYGGAEHGYTDYKTMGAAA
jgi:N-ethylmaleimide reductase